PELAGTISGPSMTRLLDGEIAQKVRFALRWPGRELVLQRFHSGRRLANHHAGVHPVEEQRARLLHRRCVDGCRPVESQSRRVESRTPQLRLRLNAPWNVPFGRTGRIRLGLSTFNFRLFLSPPRACIGRLRWDSSEWGRASWRTCRAGSMSRTSGKPRPRAYPRQ